MSEAIAFVIGFLLCGLLLVVAALHRKVRVCEVCGCTVEKLSCYAQCGHRQGELEEHLQ